MMKIVTFSLMMAVLAATAFASDAGFNIANIDKALPDLGKNAILPPAVTEKYEYYEVCGCSEKELQCDLDKKCLMWNDGKKYDSLTRWDVKWDHGYDRAPRACSADSFRVTVDIIFRYPKWARSDISPPSLVKKWERYMDNLVIHESGHRDIVVGAAAELTRAVAELPPAATCSELDQQVRSLCRERLDRLDKDQKQYDKTTKHGVMQGAVFP